MLNFTSTDSDSQIDDVEQNSECLLLLTLCFDEMKVDLNKHKLFLLMLNQYKV